MAIELRFSARSHVGMVRKGNEDSGYGSSHLLVIADGMGGHAAGEVASATALRAVLEELVPAADVFDGTAEDMPLDDASADAVTVGQAFHWFDAERAAAGEFTAENGDRLRQYLRRDVLHRDNPTLTFRTGDITSAGTLSCAGCNWTIITTRTTVLPPCPQCSETAFRKTA